MEEILKLENYSVSFNTPKGEVEAVRNINLTVNKGEILCLVGESGCGKTTTGKCILRINKPTDGKIYYKGKEIAGMSDKEFAPYRREIQLIFQDPYSSLDPRNSVFTILKEAICADGRRHGEKEIVNRVNELLYTVDLDPAMSHRFPHEMSGGQRQRLGIARALACNPELIVCDEPVSALDVSIQAQIINLLKSLQEKRNLTYLFISHDLSVVEHISDTVGVMYLGNLVEYGETDDIFAHPLHPYTKALFSAIPIPDPTVKRERVVLQGSIPSPANPPSGCKFHTRCPYATERCKTEAPKQREVEPGHYVVCHLYEK